MNTENTHPELIDETHSFKSVVIQALAKNDQVQMETLCEVRSDSKSYPVLLARSKSADPSKPTVFITAGMHGDEPAGVHAAVRFLNNEAHRYKDRFNFIVVPCINPSGFDTNTHGTPSGMNLNSYFDMQSDDDVVKALEEQIRSAAPSTLIAFDLHEDNSEERAGCYVYEILSKETGRIADQVLTVLSPKDIYTDPLVHMDLIEENNNGVIEYDTDTPEAFSTTLSGYAKKHGAQHVMTVETPTVWPLEKRIEAHLAMIRKGLEISSKKINEAF